VRRSIWKKASFDYVWYGAGQLWHVAPRRGNWYGAGHRTHGMSTQLSTRAIKSCPLINPTDRHHTLVTVSQWIVICTAVSCHILKMLKSRICFQSLKMSPLNQKHISHIMTLLLVRSHRHHNVNCLANCCDYPPELSILCQWTHDDSDFSSLWQANLCVIVR